MAALQFLIDKNVQPDTMLSFVYSGGSNPGTRRTVTFIEPHQLRSGAQGFCAEHDDRPKTYELAKCSARQSFHHISAQPKT